MNAKQIYRISLVTVLALALGTPLLAQTKASPNEQAAKPAVQAPAESQAPAPVFSGSKQKAQGIIAQRGAEAFVLRQASGADMAVKLTNATEIREKKGNPFRGAKKYALAQLVRGLQVEVEGRPDSTGALVADKIRFTNDSLKTAEVVETRVTPVENRLGTAETRLSASEDNAKRLSGQIDELGGIANAAQTGAKNAQQSADAALSGVSLTNERITSLDDYQAVKSTTVRFKVGSAVLSAEAKSALDELAEQAKTQKGFVIEVAGFASKDGDSELNRRLSDRRAQNVVRYLAENHDVPLRRIVTPFGYGASHPVADNSTHDGRVENRRVEVKILVSKGLTVSASASQPAAADSDSTKTNQRANP